MIHNLNVDHNDDDAPFVRKRNVSNDSMMTTDGELGTPRDEDMDIHTQGIKRYSDSFDSSGSVSSISEESVESQPVTKKRRKSSGGKPVPVIYIFLLLKIKDALHNNIIHIYIKQGRPQSIEEYVEIDASGKL